MWDMGKKSRRVIKCTYKAGGEVPEDDGSRERNEIADSLREVQEQEEVSQKPANQTGCVQPVAPGMLERDHVPVQLQEDLPIWVWIGSTLEGRDDLPVNEDILSPIRDECRDRGYVC